MNPHIQPWHTAAANLDNAMQQDLIDFEWPIGLGLWPNKNGRLCLKYTFVFVLFFAARLI